MTLNDDLQDIDGIGPATADKILGVLDGHEAFNEPETQAADPDAVANAIEQARRGNEGAVIDFLEGLR